MAAKEKCTVSVVERKTAQKSAWYEMKIYYRNYELLIIGAVCGSTDDNNKQACCLGSSKVPTYWIVIAPKVNVPFDPDMRLLQSFRNKASTFQWAFKSVNFARRGSHTTHPLRFYHGREIDYYSVASYVLECGSKGSITQSQLRHCRDMLHQMNFYIELGFKKKPR
ncbi:hypothetical protein MBANPS3_008665 [Mucor bainieri]